MPKITPVSIDYCNEREWDDEIKEARHRYLEVKQQFDKHPPDLLTLEEIRQTYKPTAAEM